MEIIQNTLGNTKLEHIPNEQRRTNIELVMYPNNEQCNYVCKKPLVVAVKVYNLMLEEKIENYKSTGKFGCFTPAKYKKEYPFLKEVDSLALANKQMTLLQNAFKTGLIKNEKKKTNFQISNQQSIAEILYYEQPKWYSGYR